jgi:hypothetical protein
MVRNERVAEVLRRERPSEDVCGYSLRRLAADRKGVDAEHILECQMLSHALVYVNDSEMKQLLRAVDAGKPLRQQPTVVEDAFTAIHAVHNASHNLLWTTHQINMQKKTVVEHLLKALDENRFAAAGAGAHFDPADHFQNNLLLQIQKAVRHELDDALADRVARTVAGKMRDTEPGYTQTLRDTPVEAKVQNRGKRMAMYGAVADEIVQLFDVMHI